MRIAVIQFRVRQNPEENLNVILSFLGKVQENTLVLLPEMFYTGFDYRKILKTCDYSPKILEKLSKISKDKNLVLCGSLAQRVEDRIFNSAFLIEKGKLLGFKRKIKLFKPFQEDRFFSSGEENPVFETSFGKVGILICFELRFSELVADLKAKGVDIVLVPAQWGFERKEHLKILSQARALELQSFLLVADTWGEFKNTKFAGCSGIYSPSGRILAFSEEGDTLLEVEVNFEELKKVRNELPLR